MHDEEGTLGLGGNMPEVFKAVSGVNPTNFHMNVFGETISDEESEIIDYINSREMHHEVEAHRVIAAEVKEKYGDRGAMVLEQLTRDIETSNKEMECDECGKDSSDAAEQIQENLKMVETFLDTDLEDIAEDVVCNETLQGCSLSESDVKDAITRHTDYTFENIPEDLLKRVKIKILFKGITEGWLIDEYFGN